MASENSTDSSNSVEITGNPFIDEKDSSPITNEKPKPPPKKRNSDESGTKLNEGKPVTPTKPLPLSSKAYRAPPPPNKPAPATKPRVKAIVVSSKMPYVMDCEVLLNVHYKERINLGNASTRKGNFSFFLCHCVANANWDIAGTGVPLQLNQSKAQCDQNFKGKASTCMYMSSGCWLCLLNE